MVDKNASFFFFFFDKSWITGMLSMFFALVLKVLNIITCFALDMGVFYIFSVPLEDAM